MALGDITIYNEVSGSALASRTHQVVSGGTPPAINAGELVGKTVGTNYVIIAANAAVDASSTTAKIAGVAASTSTETASADGSVQVVPMGERIWLIKPQTAATYGQLRLSKHSTTMASVTLCSAYWLTATCTPVDSQAYAMPLTIEPDNYCGLTVTAAQATALTAAYRSSTVLTQPSYNRSLTE